jgi:hypothetical protein
MIRQAYYNFVLKLGSIFRFRRLKMLRITTFKHFSEQNNPHNSNTKRDFEKLSIYLLSTIHICAVDQVGFLNWHPEELFARKESKVIFNYKTL